MAHLKTPCLQHGAPGGRGMLLRAVEGVVALALAVSGLPAWAGGIDELHQFITQFHSARGQFHQRVVNPQKTSDSEGDFVFARPGRFRWSYARPYEQVIVTDGQTLSIYDRDLNQVTVRKVSDALGATPAAILFGDSPLEKSFDLKDTGQRDGVDWLVATPKSKDTAFQSIDIGFRGAELAAMDLHDSLGQTTHLEFSNVERNVAVAPDTFHFVPPKGADVLEN